MTTGQRIWEPAYFSDLRPGLSARTFGLWLVWLTLASSSFVFIEPAPFDALMMGTMFVLPLVGLTSFSRGILAHTALWLLIGAGGLLASLKSNVMDISVKHTLITLFLSFSSVFIAAFVRKDPERHARLVMSGLIAASLVAALCGLVGYFDLVPGTQELFTKFSRARGPFKDPNVLGAFLVPALLYYLHRTITADTKQAFFDLCLFGVIALALLLSFSRGAWFNASVACASYAYVGFIASRSNLYRLRLFFVGATAVALLALGLVAALQIDAVAKLISERASLVMDYDVGPQGRFAGQLTALSMVTENPFGLGAQDFGRSYHGEDVHNVYISMFLNAGWAGGFAYFGIVVATLVAGFGLALRRRPGSPLIVVLLGAFCGVAAEGLFVDTDHWRHFFVILGVIWGLVLSDRNGPEKRMPLPLRHKSRSTGDMTRIDGRSGEI